MDAVNNQKQGRTILVHNIFSERFWLMEQRAAQAFMAARCFTNDKTEKEPWPMLRAPTKLRVGGRIVEVNARSSSGRAASGFAITANGIAVIPIYGVLLKGMGQYGYPDPSHLKSTIKFAAQDSSVKGILLVVDSPGGATPGISDLADAVAEADQKLPVYGIVEDCGCSAAYWVLAGARKIFVNNYTASVGSIGVVAALHDSSAMYQQAGVRVIPITTGAMKSGGMDGVPISDAQIEHVQGIINSIYGGFVKAVSKGRNLSTASINAMEGRVFCGREAKARGLVDEIGSLDQCFSELQHAAANYGGPNNRAKAKLAELER